MLLSTARAHTPIAHHALHASIVKFCPQTCKAIANNSDSQPSVGKCRQAHCQATFC
jgi:hypothetical protein